MKKGKMGVDSIAVHPRGKAGHVKSVCATGPSAPSPQGAGTTPPGKGASTSGI